MAEHENAADEATAATLTAIRRRALTASTYAEWHQVGRDIETLADLLAAANERAEKAEVRLAKLHAGLQIDDGARALVQQNRRELDAVIQQHVERVGVENCELRTRAEQAEAERDEARARLAELGDVRVEWCITQQGQRRPEVKRRVIGEWRDAKAADAVRDGLSASVAASGASGGSLGGSNSSASPEAPQEATPCRGCGETYCDDSRETKP